MMRSSASSTRPIVAVVIAAAVVVVALTALAAWAIDDYRVAQSVAGVWVYPMVASDDATLTIVNRVVGPDSFSLETKEDGRSSGWVWVSRDAFYFKASGGDLEHSPYRLEFEAGRRETLTVDFAETTPVLFRRPESGPARPAPMPDGPVHGHWPNHGSRDAAHT